MLANLSYALSDKGSLPPQVSASKESTRTSTSDKSTLGLPLKSGTGNKPFCSTYLRIGTFSLLISHLEYFPYTFFIITHLNIYVQIILCTRHIKDFGLCP